MTGRIFNMEHGSLVDGPGVRLTVFFKGCNLRCSWCHNPESQSMDRERMFYRQLCIGCGSCRCDKETCDFCGACALRCPVEAKKIVGEDVSAEDILTQILSDAPFYTNGGGVTFSGGECMLQPDFLLLLLKKCREQGIHTAVDTAGCVPWESFEKTAPYTDLFLYDIKLMDPDLHRQYTGVDNRRILSNLGRLLKSGAKVWVRIPVIPGVNDSVAQMEEIKAFLEQYPKPQRIELLPYHAMGEGKYPALGKQAQCFSVPSADRIRALRAVFQA